MIVFVPLVAFLVALLLFPPLGSRLREVGIVGEDMHKPGQPELPEMGGLGIVAGFAAGIILAIALETFFDGAVTIELEALMAALATILIVTLVGIGDDLLQIGQGVKALLPVIAALPLVAVKAGKTHMNLPLLGPVDFDIFYSLLLVPLGITGAANAVNMLAGFNGLEVGMGLIATGSLAVIAYTIDATSSLVLLLAMLGALLATLYHNWYPARILVGDVGTLSIGAVIAASVIIGNFEAAGVIVILPYFLDFLIKAVNRFPSTGWWGEYNDDDGKLYCPNPRPVSLCQWIMKLMGGVSERNLVLTLIGVEALFGLIALVLYAKF